MKPRIFIGSSTEGLPLAYAIQQNLERDAEVNVWNQSVFDPGDFVLESLLKQLDVADFGIFVFTPDDIVSIRHVEKTAVRDNVLFEFGMFVGRLGRENAIIVSPRGDDWRVASDLLGLTRATFDPAHADRAPQAALGTACNDIRRRLPSSIERRSRTPAELGTPLPVLRGQLTPKQQVLLDKVCNSQDPISREGLQKSFSEYSFGEIHYRIEQLRLLGFIQLQGQNNNGENLYTATYAYRLTMPDQRRLGSAAVSSVAPG